MTFPAADGSSIAPVPHDGETDAAHGIFRLGFIGAGGDGCGLADAFHRLGYRRVAALSTSKEVLDGLELPLVRDEILPLPGPRDRHEAVEATAA